jgi:ribonuclease D
MNDNAIKYVDSPDALLRLCNELAAEPWLVLDTEFIREDSYYPKLCLIQIGSATQLACIDTLAITDLSPLFKLLSNPACVKVLHAASQDLEIFFHLNGQPPAPIFDTQLAAALLGYGEQIGYANLVMALLQVELDKTQTRTDWSRRPLTKKQIDYALDDVRHLRDIYLRMLQQLTEQGRQSWLDLDFAALAAADRYRPDPEQAWLRVKNANKLKGVRLNVLRHLARWREHTAMRENKPRKWILSDDHLIALAQQMPASIEELDVRDLNMALLERYGATLLELITQARQEPEALWPKSRTYKKPSPQQEALADMVNSVLRIKAAEQAISPQLLATRDDIHELLHGERDLPLLQGWRLQVAGQAVLDILNGQTQLSIEGDEAVLTPKN